MNIFLGKYDQIRSFRWIWSHLRRISLLENFIFYEVIEILGGNEGGGHFFNSLLPLLPASLAGRLLPRAHLCT